MHTPSLVLEEVDEVLDGLVKILGLEDEVDSTFLVHQAVARSPIDILIDDHDSSLELSGLVGVVLSVQEDHEVTAEVEHLHEVTRIPHAFNDECLIHVVVKFDVVCAGVEVLV